MISHQFQPVIPAQAGIQWSAALDTGVRRCDEQKLTIFAVINGQLKIVADQVAGHDQPSSSARHSGASRNPV